MHSSLDSLLDAFLPAAAPGARYARTRYSTGSVFLAIIYQ